MFQVKICGVTTPADARAAAEAGADAIGLNFVAGSPRVLVGEAAAAVAAAVPRGVLRVGVFAGATAEEILRIAGAIGLGAIQLHGLLEADGSAPGRSSGPALCDPPDLCSRLARLPVIRAVRLDATTPADGLAAARRWIAAAAACGAVPAMALVDAGVSRGTTAGGLGGTGATVDWHALSATPRLPVPMALAGGLTPDNVAAAILATGIEAVDAASGVESAPGRKDPRLMRAFVLAARTAFGRG